MAAKTQLTVLFRLVLFCADCTGVFALTAKGTAMVTQVTIDDIELDENRFTHDDIGYWVIVLDGAIYGKFKTKDEACGAYSEVWFYHNS